ncbi:hypothetical protein MBRA_00573 [Methylobacterium brachiatum]|nr:hypothetical protein MBRA_00573 [Methylobacterium brachiatum]
MPSGHRKSLTAPAGLCTRRFTATTLFDGLMTGVRFCSPVEQNLMPILTCGNTIVLDNRPADEASGIDEPIPAALRPAPPTATRSILRQAQDEGAVTKPKAILVLMRPLAHEAISGTSSSNEP